MLIKIIVCFIFFLSSPLLVASTERSPENEKTENASDQKKNSSTVNAAKTDALIEILEDKEKRKEFIDNLKHLNDLNATLEGQKNSDNESFIHQTNSALIAYVETFAQQLIQGTHTLARFPENIIKGFTHIKYNDTREKCLDFIIVLFLSLGAGYIVEFFISLAVLRFKPAPYQLTHPMSQSLSWPRFTFSFAVGIIPLLAFAGAALFMASALEKPAIETSVHILIGIMLITRILLRYFRLLLQPFQPALRLLPLNDRNARRFFRLVGTFVQILLIGSILEQIFRVVGVNHATCETWKSIVGFGLFLVVTTLVIDYRRPVAKWLRYDDAHATGSMRIVINFTRVIARLWHIMAILLLLTFYMAWVYGSLQKVIFLGQAMLITVTLVVAWRYLNQKLSNLGQKWSKNWNEMASTKTIPTFDPKHPWHYAKTVPVAQSAYFLIPLGQFFLLIGTMILTLEAWGLNFIKILSTPQTQKYILTGLSLCLILAGIRILWALIDLVATSQLQDVEIDGIKAEPHLFTKTIVPIIRSTLKGIIVFIGFLLILSELAFDVTPIIYSLTFISLAISFGAQTMVKDIITGFLTLFEGNIKVGEYVTIGQHSGTVEAISLRSVFLRHGNGAVQSIPFSEVGYIINRSRHYTEHTITVAASHTTHVHRVYDVLMETYTMIKDHPRFGKMIIASIKINGVSHFTDTGIYVTAGIQTKPDPKGHFLKEFNALLQDNLIKAHILPPLTHQLSYTSEALS